MRIIECEQYSELWWKSRRGLPTASEFHRIITPAKWEFAAGAHTYACELIGQEYDLMYGVKDDFATTAMRNGTIMEPEARRYYRFQTGSEVKEVGLCISDCGRFGCSPDALVGDDGGLELKHPTAATQVKWLAAGGVPPEHLAQIHGSLLVTQHEWWDFLSYYPGLEPLMVRVVPDEKTLALAKALEKFHAMLTDIRQRIGLSDPVAATREPVTPYF